MEGQRFQYVPRTHKAISSVIAAVCASEHQYFIDKRPPEWETVKGIMRRDNEAAYCKEDYGLGPDNQDYGEFTEPMFVVVRVPRRTSACSLPT